MAFHDAPAGNDDPLTVNADLAASYSSFVHYLFFLMIALCVSLQYLKRKSQASQTTSTDANFDLFQRHYIAVYLCAVMSDWLKGPYIYVLYQHAGTA